MNNYQGQPQVVFVERPSNALGTAAFVLSLVAFLTAGCLSPLALFLSLAAMSKQPKDMAVAGFVLSLIGCVPVILLMVWILTMGGIARIVASNAPEEPRPPAPQSQSAPMPAVPIPVAPPTAPPKSVEPITASLRNVHTTAAPLGGSRIHFDLTNTSTRPFTNIEVEINFVDSVNDELLGKGTLKTRLEEPLEPGKSRTITMRVPHASPLNNGFPTTAVGRGVLIQAD